MEKKPIEEKQPTGTTPDYSKDNPYLSPEYKRALETLSKEYEDKD